MATIIKKYKKLILVIAFFLIIIVEFRGIFFNINKAFIDWGDTSFIAWQISITRNKLLNLDFKNVYDTNSHYPYKNSLLFTDSFLGQSVFALPLFFIKNPVLLYNIIFFFTIFLNYWCSFLLFQKLLKSDTAGFIGSFFLNNSVYFFDQIIHLQTITYWPMILVLYYLFKLIDKTENFSFKNSFLIGFFLSVQFYMAVYLGIFSIFLVTLFLAWNLFYGLFIKEDKFRFIRAFVIQSIIMGIAFIVLTYPFLIRKYLEFQQVYHQVRDMNEIIANSGNITDYLFFLPQTFFSSLSFIAKYNSHVRFTSERISFPGFILFAGAILGFITRKKKGGIFNLILFFSLIGTGFVFSLGPRLMANGKYMVTPLPYLAFLKIFDFLFSIRLTHRWAIFLIIGLVYFATQYYSKLSKSLIIIVLFLFVLESIPIKIPPKHKEYLNKSYQYLKKAYLKDKVLLEYPLLSFERGVGVDDETMRLLASVYHKMKLFNGYTGLFISDYGTMRIYLEKFFPDPLTDGMIKALGIDYLKIDKNFVNKEQ